MACARGVLAVIVAAVIGACSASGAVSPAPMQTSTPRTVGTSVVASPSLEATNSARSPIPASAPETSPNATPLTVLPKPSGVSFAETRAGEDHPPSTEITQTVTWIAPAEEGVEIKVYGVTECIARPLQALPNSSGPCLVTHTPLPATVRTLLATAPASDGAASWTWTGTFDCEIGLAYDPNGPIYHAIVLAAYSSSGQSIFAIAEPGSWWQPGLDDIVC